MGPMKMTALHLAAQEGNVESLQTLVSGGANVNAKNARCQFLPHFYAQLLPVKIPKLHKNSLVISVFMHFWDLRT